MLLLTCLLCKLISASLLQEAPGEPAGQSNASRPLDEHELVFVSTLDGRLEAVEQRSGAARWTLVDEPLVRAPVVVRPGFTFVADPQDGSLYALGAGRLSKLPFTVPQLVHAAPCKSAAGVLYAGSKKDTWLAVDPLTGRRLDTLSAEPAADEAYCPASDRRALYLGRTEYRLSMFDGASRARRWNATYMDYTAHALPPDAPAAGLCHMASCADGTLAAVDPATGELAWRRDFGAPVVGVYVLRQSGLHRVRHTVFGKETLEQLLEAGLDGSTAHLAQYLHASAADVSPARLYRTLYVGETPHGLYALPSYVDERTVTIAAGGRGPPLLDGPKPIAEPAAAADGGDRRHVYVGKVSDDSTKDVLLLGHHEQPAPMPLELVSRRQASPAAAHVPYITYEPEHGGGRQVAAPSAAAGVTLESLVSQFAERHAAKLAAVLGAIAAVLFTSVLWCCCRADGLHRQWSSFDSQRGRSSRQSSSGGRGGGPLRQWLGARGHPVPAGWLSTGRIHYDPGGVLGRGCEGTVVYRGQFDGREVAVKRVVTEFLNLADREVDLLRESDSHAHVIRYYCMEADSQFRYIALELCWATLQDFVDSDDVRRRSPLTALDILKEATAGLAYLHSLKIVHRDLKPPNVLLSMPDGAGRVRALISDFGLCKKLPAGRSSLSRRSGVAGTDGWIAPELLDDAQSVTCSADVFSLGCVYCYVLTRGAHPFGDALRRQANIAQGEPCFDRLDAVPDGPLYGSAVGRMLSADHRRRPPAAALLRHPMFWPAGDQLGLLQDVSDRVEKDERTSPLLRRLEAGGRAVLAGDWRLAICPALQTDLRKFRTYRGGSVRDLLRAVRNKRHHYRELPDELRRSLGAVPEEFARYFTGRFPLLLAHVYAAAEMERAEPLFRRYYGDGDFEWWLEPRLAKGPVGAAPQGHHGDAGCVDATGS